MPRPPAPLEYATGRALFLLERKHEAGKHRMCFDKKFNKQVRSAQRTVPPHLRRLDAAPRCCTAAIARLRHRRVNCGELRRDEPWPCALQLAAEFAALPSAAVAALEARVEEVRPPPDSASPAGSWSRCHPRPLP
jgi:hypothetical protein